MFKRWAALALVVSLWAPSLPSAFAASKAGTKCTKLGRTTVSSGLKYTCVKSGRMLRWSKGVVLQQTVSTPVKPIVVEAPPPTLTENSQFQDMSICQLKQVNQNGYVNGFGFPRPSHRLKNFGEVRGILVFVEFTDVKGTDVPSIEGKKFTTNFEKYFDAVSYGNLKFKVEIHPSYIAIPKPSASYGMTRWNGGKPMQYFQDGLTFSDPYIDFTPYEFAVFIPPSEIKDIVYGPSFPLFPGDPTGTTAERLVLNGAVGGADQRNRIGTQWIWLAHEIGHTLGMEHQFGYFPAPIWDLMDNVYVTNGPELFAWHRFLQGWLSPANVACASLTQLSQGKLTVDVTALENHSEEKKALILKLSDSEALVVEARKNIGFDNFGTENDGLLAYIVDVNKESNQRAITLITSTSPTKISNGQIIGTIRPKESVSYGDFRIENLGSSSNGYYVQVSRG